LESQEANRLESDAVDVAVPHHRGSRASRVEFTIDTIAARRFSRVM
jgi:hypothetical protein